MTRIRWTSVSTGDFSCPSLREGREGEIDPPPLQAGGSRLFHAGLPKIAITKNPYLSIFHLS